IVSEAHKWKRKVAAHCHGDAAARIAIEAGVDSIEHGTFLTEDTLKLMKAKGVYLVPTRMAAYWVGKEADAGAFPSQIAANARARQGRGYRSGPGQRAQRYPRYGAPCFRDAPGAHRGAEDGNIDIRPCAEPAGVQAKPTVPSH